MSHKVPITVYTIWLNDHIHTSVDGDLAVFYKLKDAEAWVIKYGALSDAKVRKMQVVPYKEPEKKKRTR